MGKGKMKITDEIYWSIPWDPSVTRRILTLKRRNSISGPSNLHKSLESHLKNDQHSNIDQRSNHIVSPT